MDLETITGGDPAAEAEFTCSLGHGRAGAVRLFRAGADAWAVVVESFVCRATCRVAAAGAPALCQAIEAGDAARLFRIDPELAPFYCPACDAVYCGTCWRTYHVFDDEMPGWLEETRGGCPRGHDRMLVD